MSSITDPPHTPGPLTEPGPERYVDQDTSEASFVNDPWRLYRRLHQRPGPDFWAGYGFWCLKGHADVDAALRDKRFKRLPPPADTPPPWPPHLARFADSERFSLLALEGSRHARLRRQVTRAFVSREVARLAPGIRTLAHACIDRFEGDGGTDLLARYATPIPVTVIARLLGLPDERIGDLRRWSAAMVQVYTLTQNRAQEEAAERAADEFIACLQHLIERRRAAPADDLISHLLALRVKPEPLLDAEIVSTAILLLNAGHEATVHQLGNAVLTLLQARASDAQRRAWLQDDAQADACVLELTRYRAPLHLFLRYAQQPLSLPGGVRLAAGERVGLLLGAANRDPARFADPDVFDPGRADAGSLAFGAGVHYCLGVQLARLELRIALQVLFERLPGLRLDGTPRYADTFHFHGLTALPVRW